MFSTERFVHFVFANVDDTYYLGNMLELDLNGYLWVALKKKGFENVYFFSGTDTDCIVETLDSSSCDNYSQRNASLLSKFFGFKSGESEDKRQSFSDRDISALCNWITDSLVQSKKQKKQAFVFQLDTLSRLFGKPEQLDNLKRLIEYSRQNSKSGIIVVCAPNGGSELVEELVGKSSIFMVQSNGHCLSEDLYALRKIPEKPLFQAIQEHMQDCQMQLYIPKREEICSLLVRRAIETNDWPESVKDLDKQAAFLTAWCRSESLQENADLTWKPGRFPKYSALWEKLCTPRFYTALCRQSELYDLSGLEREPLVTEREDHICSMIRSLWLPDAFLYWVSSEEKVRQQFRDFRYRAATLWSKPVNQQVTDYIERFLNSFQQAVKNEDWATLERILHILSFCADHICTGEERSVEIGELCELYKSCVVEMSFAYTRYQRNYERVTQQLKTASGSVRMTLEAQQSIYLAQATSTQTAIRETESKLGFIMQDFDLRPVDFTHVAEEMSKITSKIDNQNQVFLSQMEVLSGKTADIAMPLEEDEEEMLPEQTLYEAVPEVCEIKEEDEDASLQRGEQEALRRLWQ